MKVESLRNSGLVSNGEKTPSRTASFSEAMKKQLEEVNTLQAQAQESSEKLALGQAESIHEVMIQTEEARLALEMTVQVRNKVVEAYQEIMKMQI